MALPFGRLRRVKGVSHERAEKLDLLDCSDIYFLNAHCWNEHLGSEFSLPFAVRNMEVIMQRMGGDRNMT